MGRRKSAKATQGGDESLQQRALTLSEGDRSRASDLLLKALVELWSDAGHDEASLALFHVSDATKRAGQQHLTTKMLDALGAQLRDAKTDQERWRIAAQIAQLTPAATPSPEALRINAEAQRVQLAALFKQRARTTVDRDKIDEQIGRIQLALDAYDRSVSD